MIDRTTLPNMPAETSVTVGQQFVVRGRNFRYWPSEIVLGHNNGSVQGTVMPNSNIMKLVSRTDTELVFEATVDYTYPTAHLWDVFGSPFDAPREILQYE